MTESSTKTRLSQKANHSKPSKWLPDPLGHERVKTKIKLIRKGFDPDKKDADNNPTRLRAFERDEKVLEVIIEDLESRGLFYSEDEFGYYQDISSHKLISLTDNSTDLAILLRKYGLNATEAIYKYVAQDLYIYSIEQGEQIKVQHFSHLRVSDTSDSVLCVAADNNMIIRVTKDSITLVENGTDGVLFMTSKYTAPSDISLKPTGGRNYLRSLILDDIPFDTTRMTKEESGFYILSWTMSLFMREIIADQPILALIGPKGSGKTTAIRMIGKTLFGPGWEVNSVGRDESDFDTVITTQDLVGLDNVDGKIAWLNDKLAVVATGGKISKRALYTTNKLAEYPIICAIALSSRTPEFRRDDVAERLIILNTKELNEADSNGEQDYGSDVVLKIEQKRKELWGELLTIAQGILRILDETDWRFYRVPGYRMQEFARFTVIVGKALGDEHIELLRNRRQPRVTSSLKGSHGLTSW